MYQIRIKQRGKERVISEFPNWDSALQAIEGFAAQSKGFCRTLDPSVFINIRERAHLYIWPEKLGGVRRKAVSCSDGANSNPGEQ